MSSQDRSIQQVPEIPAFSLPRLPWGKALLGRLGGWERLLILAAGIGVLLALVLPIWRVYLWAPQYPEGLRIFIHARNLTGDIQNVNILNHYIGMKPLTVEAFPEFIWLTPVLASVGGLILLAALVGRREGMALGWLVLIAFDFFMLYDFHFWLYDWGHTLDPHAPIRMDPFTPPLIGYKHIANFYVWSHPAWGGVPIVLASLIGPLLVCYTLWRSRQYYSHVP